MGDRVLVCHAGEVIYHMGDRMRQRGNSRYQFISLQALRLVGTALLVGAVQWGMTRPLQAQEAAKPSTPPPDNTLEWVKVAISGAGTLATIVGGVFVFWNVRLTASRLITERFSKAVEQLGSDKIEVRLGGIYALERIAQDSRRDHWTIMEVLTAFVREKSPVEPTKPKKRTPLPKDVQAALTVIGRRRQQYDRKELIWRLDLTRSNLSRAQLTYTNFRKANFTGADFTDAVLSGTDLTSAILSHANLKGTKLFSANLSHTFLWGADLSGASLKYANLSNASLWGTNLSGAPELTEEKLSQAILCRTTLPDGTVSDRDRAIFDHSLPNAPTPAVPSSEPPLPPAPDA